jgi:hypothetical protein
MNINTRTTPKSSSLSRMLHIRKEAIADSCDEFRQSATGNSWRANYIILVWNWLPLHFFFQCLPLTWFIFFPKTVADATTHLACDEACYPSSRPLRTQNVLNQGLHQTHFNWASGLHWRPAADLISGLSTLRISSLYFNFLTEPVWWEHP